MLGGISTKSRKALGRFLILIAAALGLWAVFYLLLLVEGDGALALYAVCAYVLPPLCALLLPWWAVWGGVYPALAFLPIGGAMLLSPFAPGWLGWVCLSLSLIAGVGAEEWKKRKEGGGKRHGGKAKKRKGR